ncbi:hypothetical protein BDA96_05G240500 [Sorghum bicolor]|uniref:AAA+ ATPase domain-containing protein n=1 Tax=Sorghum bicolor TaxID=4558 RepID=A0A921R076_SORBI|nr:hypothetical protein BDA96_05G240500 [Sorghum bicolor]KAG0531046.1 hypothetical protein BDA96_05G240500 [Sorghum bicolor]
MESATGALGTLLPKLGQLLQDEYNLQKGVKKDIQLVTRELESMHAALRDVGEVPQEQLIEVIKIWARDVRELSYDLEDIVDTFLVRVQGSEPPSKRSVKRFTNTMTSIMSNVKIRQGIKGIKERVKEVAERRHRYKVYDIAPTKTLFDPRITALYSKAASLVGIDEPREELISILTKEDGGMLSTEQRIVSIVGSGGLGKTTLAKAVYDKVKPQFSCTAFVSVSRDPDITKVFKEMLYELDNIQYKNILNTTLGQQQLIDLVHGFLKHKRYLVVIDDIWDTEPWEIIRSGLPDNDLKSRIITTTRIIDVAEYVGGCYKMKPLTHHHSKILFYGRIFGSASACPKQLSEVSENLLKKCGGVPLAIVTISSLLANKYRVNEWHDVCDSIGSGLGNNPRMDDMRKILLLSYYELTPQLKTCLLYLSIFPEDYVIDKLRLIWRWIAEGFVQQGDSEETNGLFELGESYFNELINRSLIQLVEIKGTGLVYGCQVHDLVLDLICSLSRQENFVSVLSEGVEIFPSSKICRLAIHNRKEGHNLGDNMNLLHPQLRSLTAFECPMYMIPPVVSFKLLRVLDLESCGSLEGYDLKHLGKLLLLRFISLRNTFVRMLPEELGHLKILQTLELQGSGVEDLPASIGELKGLMCLNADWTTRVADWIGKLTSLQHLLMYPGDGNDEHSVTRFVTGLGNLTDLRELRLLIKAYDEEQLRDLLETVLNLPKIVVLHFDYYGAQLNSSVNLEHSGFARCGHLRSLELQLLKFSSLPVWINARHLPKLCHLSLMLFDVDEQDLEKLGQFAELSHLHLLIVNTERRDAITCASGGFQNLRFFSITKPLKFLQGAMPKLEVLDFHFNVWLQTGAERDLDFFLGLGYLPSLRQVIIQINSLDAIPEVVEETEAALREAIHMHPNHPIPDISLSRQKLEKADNDRANNISYSDKGKGVEVAKGGSKSAYYSKSLSLARDGIDEPMDEIIKMLSEVDNEAYDKKLKIVPIVRSEGRKLKTTLAQKVFDKLKPQFDCAAFVLVGQNPDMRKVFTDILVGLDKQKFQDFHMTILNIMELIWLVRKSLINKRFFVVIDDIWDLKAWDIIKCALIGNSSGSAILVTSPNFDITVVIGGGEQLLPLSPSDSKKIFCKKLFGSENDCPAQLENICDNLIETCGGILSVIDETVTWLESIPPTVKEWQAVYERRKLDLSYPKLPDYLKKSLLYFSMFPKGYEISVERLVWAWIAEDFVHGTQGPQDLQKVQRSYISELIKENKIEAVEVDADGMALSCRAKDFVHDFIVSKSTKENLVAILNDSPNRALSTTVDRLSIQGNHSQQKAWFSKVKSLVAACDNLPTISGFTDLRVMDLAGCDSLQASHLKDIKKTTSLSYLAIGGKYIADIPTEITKLKLLRTLDLTASGLSELPQCIFLLKYLERLFVNGHMKIPDGIAKMSALQELGDINIVKPKTLKKLRKLSKLKVLRIAMWSWDEDKSSVEVWWDTLRSVLGFCKNIESLSILTFCSLDFMDGFDDNRGPPQTLKKLEIRHSVFHDKLPSWFGSLANVSSLTIEVNKLSKNINNTLGKLSALCSLSLTSKEVPEVYFVIDSETFKKLESLKFVCSAMIEMFAGPQSNDSQSQQLKRLTIVFQASRTKDINKDFSFGLDNLCSLEHVRVEINCFNANHQMVNNAEDAIRKELFRAGSGSSQPNLEIRRLDEESMVEEEDQTTGHRVARTSSLKTQDNGDESDSMDLLECTMKTSAEVASKVLYHDISNNTFLNNVGILMSSTKIEKWTERMLQHEKTTEQQCSTALHREVDKLKQALANTQKEFEEFKKQMEEKICSLSVSCI